ncbi:MAG: hypothetical protein C0507_01850 [Cyanobacteria bacterium PR.3.49]|nr:hypothetical protein [Cyanobacteria bacterium PR.3.49]
MKFKIALCLAASFCVSSDLFTLSASAQGTPAAPSADGPSAPGSMPQSAPDLGDRSGKWKRLDGQGGGRMRERMMEKFDANHDGTIDDAERSAMRAKREQRMQQRGMGGGAGRMGLDGSNAMPAGGPAGLGGAGQGQGMGRGDRGRGGMGINDEQRQARRQKMLDRFDTNHDGQLDDAEKSQMREQFGNRGGGGRHKRRGNWGGSGAQNAPNSDPTGGLPPTTPAN